MPPARFALDGSVVADDWPNFQIDGYGTWLWALERAPARTGQRRHLPPEFTRVGRARRRATSTRSRLTPASTSGRRTATRGPHLDPRLRLRRPDGRGALLETDGLAERAAEVQLQSSREGAGAAGPLRQVERDRRGRRQHCSGSSTPFGARRCRRPALRARPSRAIEEQLTLRGRHPPLPERHLLRRRRLAGADRVARLALRRAGNLAAARRCRDWVAGHFDADGRLGEQFGGERRDPEHYHRVGRALGAPGSASCSGRTRCTSCSAPSWMSSSGRLREIRR